MITLEKIIASNLEMLKSQESELLKSLSFVQKAKKLFQSQSGTPQRGRPKGKLKRRKKITTGVKATSRKSQAGKAVRGKATPQKAKSVRVLKAGTHISNIVNALKQKNAPVTSRELIDTLFSQKKIRTLNTFADLFPLPCRTLLKEA